MRLNSHNFSGGPGVLPQPVLDQLQRDVQGVPEIGLSILGISHRSVWFSDVVQEAQNHIRSLLRVGPGWHILFLQGGSSLQFNMAAMNLGCHVDSPADFIVSGYWSNKAYESSKASCKPQIVWSGQGGGYSELPELSALAPSKDASFFHYVSNETVEGIQFETGPKFRGVPIVCDMSSDFLTKPFDVDGFDIIYAHAQKNLGPAGVTIVLVKDEIVRAIPNGLPPVLDYRRHIQESSIYNTPPVFSIYTMTLVLRWMVERFGSLDAVRRFNVEKASLVYDALDQRSDFFKTHAKRRFRSTTNVAFDIKGADPTHFLRAASALGFTGLEGHRSLGGFRASLYNAMTLEATQDLASFLLSYRPA